MSKSVFVHIVTFNSSRVIQTCLKSVLAQQGLEQLIVGVTDNASTDACLELIRHNFGAQVRVRANQENLGFCGAHNQGALDFLNSDCSYFCVLNPDVRLEPTCLAELIGGLAEDVKVGLATPLLLRADANLDPLQPFVVDAAGMELTPALRHFDRGAGAMWSEEFERARKVFGGTGACLLLSRDCVNDLILPSPDYDEPVFSVYPQLRAGAANRAALFDEAFFAYREDADLCWRAGILGWECLYVPSARAYHQRVVTPERRQSLPAILNAYGVRNRFLLQLNNFSFAMGWRATILGLIVRNLVVALAVILYEWSSLPALKEALVFSRRALARRRIIFNRARTTSMRKA